MRAHVFRGQKPRMTSSVNPSNNPQKRRWERLPIAVPVFVRGRDERGNEFLDFTTAININAGGMLLLSRRSLPAGMELIVEIPTPTPSFQPPGCQTRTALPARVLYTTHSEDCYLCGVEFSSPLLPDEIDKL
jgi:hypothetical protein